ncbi:hypothetical protein [Sporosalibacterium faouarense]|nr:hypothetical protein [Sporosalibacterium faouarense]
MKKINNFASILIGVLIIGPALWFSGKKVLKLVKGEGCCSSSTKRVK